MLHAQVHIMLAITFQEQMWNACSTVIHKQIALRRSFVFSLLTFVFLSGSRRRLW